MKLERNPHAPEAMPPCEPDQIFDNRSLGSGVQHDLSFEIVDIQVKGTTVAKTVRRPNS